MLGAMAPLFTSEVELLLGQAIEPLPLTCGGLEARARFDPKLAESLFPDARDAAAAAAGLALRAGDWELTTR
jgi:hypothetical protein